MTKKKGWQLALILTVMGLTIYNILPTLFFYTKPLHEPLSKKDAIEISKGIEERVNGLEKDAIAWVHSFNKLLGIKAKSVAILSETPDLIEVRFEEKQSLEIFKKYLPKAGSLIPFYPASLSLAKEDASLDTLESDKTHSLLLQRKIPIHFQEKHLDDYFSYSPMFEESGLATPEYWNVLQDRLLYIALAVGGPTENASLVHLALEQKNDPRSEEFLYLIAETILSIESAFNEEPSIAKAFYQTFTQGSFSESKSAVIASLTESLLAYKDRIQLQKIARKEALAGESEALVAELDAEYQALGKKEALLLKAAGILKNEKASFLSGENGWTIENLGERLSKLSLEENSPIVSFQVGANNPVVESIQIDWSDKTFSLNLKKELLALRDRLNQSTEGKARFETMQQLIYNEIARISRQSEETFTPKESTFALSFQDLPGSMSFINLNLAKITEAQFSNVEKLVKNHWHPVSEDLKRESYPIINWADYQRSSESDKHLKLVLYAPSLASTPPIEGFRPHAIYVIAKDLNKIVKKFSKTAEGDSLEKTSKDFNSLYKLLQSYGFVGYPGTTYPIPAEFRDDYIFEVSDFYLPVLQATREDFHVHGSKQRAILELSDLEERLLTINQIETKIHEDLLKWRDEYNAARIDLSLDSYFDVPKPTKNVLWSNFILSCKKYFRGDDRKILHWGIDLAGGKSVQIALKDANQELVTNEADLKQGMNELYGRINKMGVSDVSIRQEGSNITIDFPGSQSLSASELIKASSMTFNIVNETFAPASGKMYAAESTQFLQEIWNEAVVTNKKDIVSINRIAWSHLYGDSLDPEIAEPRTESARVLFEAGLRLANPEHMNVSYAFDTTESMLAMYRGDSFADWGGSTHPLLIVFKNFALEGSNLENIHTGYDPSKGNFLSFGVKSSQTTSSGEKISPSSNLFAWTQVFSKDKVVNTSYEAASGGHGWRMAVILNGSIVSAPRLESALKDSGMITGHFTQRELSKLSADLKAGSLTFTPEILSEKSVTPDLGIKERYQGITATIVALFAVIVVMIAYYRFGGVVASIAVLFNLLIMWATLQNIGATITLANLAGVVLTVGMAVDANVLVFERIREEFAKTGKIAQAVASGYQKAFSAIFDSNITTLIAALILLNFDAGPIKGFAVTLIIGIVSSLFTALFMTRFFFSHWVKNPKHKSLKMANLIRPRNWDFLKYGKVAVIVSLVLVVAGGCALLTKQNTILGMDFTGGYSVTLEVAKKEGVNYRKAVESALVKGGASMQDIQVRELVPSNQMRIFLSKSLSLSGKPFYGMPMETEIDHPLFSYETNPKLIWLVNALETNGLTVTEKAKIELDQSWKSVSGQMSDTMRNNALIGLSLALLSILIYITLRFEFTYAISATIGILFDVVLTLAVVSILHFLSVPIQIDLNAVGALMTIVGYSLNDTIIVFDRVREDAKLMQRSSFKDVINHAMNVTLSRTLLTSGTTLIVLLALVFLGGSTIFGFSLIMSIGVVIGTLSTFFIAALLLLYFHKKEKGRKQDVVEHVNGEA